MSDDHIRYDLLVQDALRGVVRRVMSDVAKYGLPADHHFFISFDTRAPGARVSPRLRAQYPEEMTIVLQHQFWDLTVTETGMEVGLSFGGVPEKLSVPFDAIRNFVDPSVQFALEFEPNTEKARAPATPPAPSGLTSVPLAEPTPAAAAPAPRERATPSKRKSDRAPPAAATAEEQPTETDPAPTPSGGAEVVRLDRFRKK